MNKLIINGTSNSPKLFFDCETNVLEIMGYSYMENVVEFYKPIFKWLSEYLATLSSQCIVKMNLNYFNTSSSRCIMKLLDMLEEKHLEGYDIQVYWYYDVDNESLKELGEDFKSELKLNFDIVPLKND